MANIEIKYAWVNKKKLIEGEGGKTRLQLQLSESRKDKKSGKTFYTNYMTTLWDEDAIKYNDLIQEKTETSNSSSVYLKGWITEVSSILSKKDNTTIYTTIFVNILDNQFGINDSSGGKATTSSTSPAKEDDDFFS